MLLGFGAFFTVICVLLPRLSLNQYELRPMIYLDLFFGSPDFHRLFFPTPLRVARVDQSRRLVYPIGFGSNHRGPRAQRPPLCGISELDGLNGILLVTRFGGQPT